MEHFNTDLNKLMNSSKKGTLITESHSLAIMYNTLVGIMKLHQMGIVHRDLKPSNIMVDEECQVKIIDYGLARPISKRAMSPHVMTRHYRPPEVALAENYDQRADIFSLGCIFYELMSVTLA